MTELTQTQISQFKEYLLQQGHPETTISSYLSDVNQYFEQYSSLSRDNILQYKSQFKEANTINRKLTSLKQYNEYLYDNRLIDALYINKSYYVKLQKKGNPLNVTDKEVENFFNRVNKSNNLRDIALTYLIANTGIRREESTNVKLSDIDFTKAKITVYEGKGNKQRELPLNNDTIKILKQYIDYRNGVRETGRLNYKYSKESEYLFLSERAIKIAKETVNAIFKLYKGDNITPHQLRHYYATIMIESESLNLLELKKVLGHDTVKTTEIYAEARQETIAKKINKVTIGFKK